MKLKILLLLIHPMELMFFGRCNIEIHTRKIQRENKFNEFDYNFVLNSHIIPLKCCQRSCFLELGCDQFSSKQRKMCVMFGFYISF